MKKAKKLEKELNMLSFMIKGGLIDFDELKEILKDIGKRYDISIILRNHNITTDTRTIEYI